jgi:hypothetical protein
MSEVALAKGVSDPRRSALIAWLFVADAFHCSAVHEDQILERVKADLQIVARPAEEGHGGNDLAIENDPEPLVIELDNANRMSVFELNRLNGADDFSLGRQ